MTSVEELSAGFSLETEFNDEVNTVEPSPGKHFDDLKSVINKVKNMQVHPAIQVYTIKNKKKDIVTAEASQGLDYFAYSLSHSDEIHLVVQKSLSNCIARKGIRGTWLNYFSARDEFAQMEKCEQEKAECFSSPQMFIIGHDDVIGLCFSLDDNLLLSCSLNGSVKAISTTTRCVLECYEGFGSSTGIDINANTTNFVTTNVIPTNPFHVAYLYDFERKDFVQCYSGHEDSLTCVRFHPNGLYIATASSDKTIKLYNINQAKPVRSFSDVGKHPDKITFSPDGKHIASTHGNYVNIWDISSGNKVNCLETGSDESCILNVCYNLAGNMLAAGGSDEKIQIWNIMSEGSPEIKIDYNFLKSEYLGKPIYCVKSVANFFSCVVGGTSRLKK